MIRHILVTAVIALSLLVSCGVAHKTASVTTAENGFANVPDSVRIGCYYYWISNHISKEGVIRDLHAMKEAGITRAFIGNVTNGGMPLGPVNFMSDEWWDITHAAFKTAGELGIEMGTFNSPGWSQSGGPWINEDQSMRRVAFKEDIVEGKGAVKSIALPDVPSNRIISVYAFPAIEGRYEEFILSGGGSIHIKLDRPMTVRSLLVSSVDNVQGRSWFSKGGETIKEFIFDRSNNTTHVGWDPAAPQVIAIPEIEGDEFDFRIETRNRGSIKVAVSDIPYVEKYAEKSFAKMFQGTLPPWDYYMWDAPADRNGAEISKDSIIPLEEFISKDGRSIEWKVPDGRWTVFTTYAVTTGEKNAPAVPEATGLEVDKMNKKHIRYHFDSYLGEILRRIPAEDRKTFKISVLDSYEMGGQNWTDDMVERFEKTFGYSPVPYLPALRGYVVNSDEETERFLWDMRRLIADGVAFDYVQGLKEVCHENGLLTWLENYGHWGFPSEFLAYGGQSDQVAGEFWAGRNHHVIDTECKDAASCGHIYGKKQIWAESSTSGDEQFQRAPAMLKPGIDNSFIAGINATLLHVYIQQPEEKKPGISAWFGTEFNRHNTWFGFMDLYTDYLKRCNYLLQQGNYAADAAYFIGEDAPKMDGICDPALPEGYSFDFINADVLKNHARVEKGCLVLDGGMSYRVLVLPKQTTMRPEMLDCIAGLVKAGLTIVGPKPDRSPSLQNWPDADAKVRALADKIWAGSSYGKGRVYADGTSMETVFADLGIAPDCLFDTEEDVRFIHRHLDDSEIYFISNAEDHAVSFKALFRDSGFGGAEIWDPVTGDSKGVTLVTDGGKQSVALTLEQFGSAFVVLRNNAAPVREYKIDRSVKVEGPWKIDFDAESGNPAFSKVQPALTDWSVSEDENVRYFSGTAHYSSSFEITGGAEKYILDLGKVMVMAKVRINGEYAGGVWTMPYALDVTPLVHEGVNTIEVDVVNNWINRLIGDSRKPAELRGTWTATNPAHPAKALQSSGLLGPVTVTAFK